MAKTKPTPDPLALVRVRDAITRHEYTTTLTVADSDPARYEVLDEDAADYLGRPLPPTPHPSPAAQADTTETA